MSGFVEILHTHACDGCLLFLFFEKNSQMRVLLYLVTADHLGYYGPLGMMVLWLISPGPPYGRSFQGLWHRGLGLGATHSSLKRLKVRASVLLKGPTVLTQTPRDSQMLEGNQISGRGHSRKFEAVSWETQTRQLSFVSHRNSMALVYLNWLFSKCPGFSFTPLIMLLKKQGQSPKHKIQFLNFRGKPHSVLFNPLQERTSVKFH